MAVDDRLNVVALVSGGKDSFYSILHCLANGHRVIALANLYPPPEAARTSAHATVRSDDGNGSRAEADNIISNLAAIRISPSDDLVAQHQHGSPSEQRVNDGKEDDEDEIDLNSFMYQTVGHQVIPLYAQATGLPLFRQVILGSAVDSGVSYKDPDGHHEEADETESLVPLFRAVLKAHPEVNALCTGAILSTYQRTRVESVALRLGLIPLAYLWQYPELPAPSATSAFSTESTSQLKGTDDAQLLRDMAAAGLVARVVKVASAGLGEEFLWENVASDAGISRIRRALRRFGGDGGRGAVLGEGGEFETLVVDGPPALFKGRVVVRDDDKRVVREGGGSAWLSIGDAQIELKSDADLASKTDAHGVRIPSLLDSKFEHVLKSLSDDSLGYEHSKTSLHQVGQQPTTLSLQRDGSISQDWYFVGKSGNIESQTAQIVNEIRQQLDEHSLPATAITNSIIVLRRMADFPTVNKLYGALFREPNPPARVTISCGDLLLPKHADITISLTVQPRMKQGERRGLHVQSRSYWAPANIGPYSQAITYPLLTIDEKTSSDNVANSDPPLAISIAGQIPLIPASMVLPSGLSESDDTLQLQVTLALQHLWRVGAEMQVQWWSSAVAYFPRSPTTSHAKHRAFLAASAWRAAHEDLSSSSSDEEEGPDLWDQKYNPLYMTYGNSGAVGAARPGLPDWEVLRDFDPDAYSERDGARRPLPFVFSAEVEELPREAGVEWHAHLGFAGVGFGSVRLYVTNGLDGEKDWTLHHVVVESSCGGVFVQTVAVYQDSGDAHREIGEAIDGAALATVRAVPQILGIGDRGELSGAVVKPKLTYIVSESFDLREGESLPKKGAIIPCRSLWDSQARKLDMVVILETRWEKRE